ATSRRSSGPTLTSGTCPTPYGGRLNRGSADLWRPCTPSPPHEIRTPTHRDFVGTPGSAGPASPVLAYAFSECARCGPRRRTTIWGTWPPNLSQLPYRGGPWEPSVERKLNGCDQGRA